MRRTTISLPEDLADALAREARRRTSSVSSVARDALAEHLNVHPGERRPLPFAAVGRSGVRDTARRMEELIAAEWDEPARGS